jgi:diadenosine tetraphosphatase ApaH/serine/threonine PP2A family protein phosphatase
MKAFISDIHANFEALSAVCADIDSLHVDEIICLGDIVGYGAEPEACVDFVMQKCALTLMGNHDWALINGPIGFNPIAADVIRLTQGRMDPARGDERELKCEKHGGYFPCAHDGNNPPCLIMNRTTGERWEFIRKLPHTNERGKALLVHASVLEPIFEYVFPDRFPSLWNPGRLQLMFDEMEWISLCGHTHHPCAITDEVRCIYPEQVGYRLGLERKTKYILNLGSVGQPRDNDPRASYLLFDEKTNTVEWRRIEYDIGSAARKIEAMCGAGNWCAERLKRGK